MKRKGSNVNVSETKTTELRAFFLDAADEERKQREEEQARIIAMQAVAACRAWEKFAPGWEPDSAEGRLVRVGDLTFRHLPAYAGHGSSSRFQLLGTCPVCEQTAWSVPCRTAADVAGQLESFETERDHGCQFLSRRVINDGDVVDVRFTDGEIGEEWTVLNRPANTGEMWDFRMPDGSVVAINPCASSFEGVYLESKKDKEGVVPQYNFKGLKEMRDTSPSDVQDNDAVVFKVVAVAYSGGGFWRAFRGPSEWSDQEIADHGDEIPEEAANLLFFALAHSGRVYG